MAYCHGYNHVPVAVCSSPFGIRVFRDGVLLHAILRCQSFLLDTIGHKVRQRLAPNVAFATCQRCGFPQWLMAFL